MTKEERKALKAERDKKFMPKWVRTLLLWAGVIFFALAIVFTVLASVKGAEANLANPDFTKLEDSGFVAFVVMAITTAALGVALFATHIVLPKAGFKKKVSIGNTVFAAILMLATIFSGILSTLAYEAPIPKYYNSADMTIVSGNSGTWVIKAKQVSKHLKSVLSEETELTKFLDKNEALQGIISGFGANADENYVKNFYAHPHKAYTNSTYYRNFVICDFYLGSSDVSALQNEMENYSMPSDKTETVNQAIWVTYGSSQVFWKSAKESVVFTQYSSVTPNFDKYGTFGSVECFYDGTNDAIRLIFGSRK